MAVTGGVILAPRRSRGAEEQRGPGGRGEPK